MNTKKTVAATFVVGAVAAALATQALGGQEPQPSANERATAHVASAQRTLSKTPFAVTSGTLAVTKDDIQVYTLEGPDTACIDLAGADSGPGQSGSLACASKTDVQNPNRPLYTGYRRADGTHVAIVWQPTGGSAIAAKASNGVSLAAKSYGRVAVIEHAADQAVDLTWRGLEGKSAHIRSGIEQEKIEREGAARALAQSTKD